MLRPLVARVAVLVPVLAIALGLTGCTSEAPEPDAKPSVDASPLASYDTGRIAVVRSPFCDRITSEAVRDALGDAADDTVAWNPGDPVPGLARDRGHEFGCRYATDDGIAAQAWLFAPPVTPARARELMRESKGCWRAEGTDFGDPSAATRCGSDGTVAIGYRGLFGDAWLSCTVEASGREEPADLTERADRWCAQVLEATRVR
jgi:hypothetical protein